MVDYVNTTSGPQLAARAGRGDLRALETLLRQIINSVGPLNTEAALLDGLLATAAELNRVSDVSTRIVNLAVSTAITELAHSDKVIVMGGAGSARTFTLPPSTGSGARFRFMVGAVNTSNYLIKSVAGTDTIDGTVLNTDSDTSGALRGFTAAATDDTITLNGTTTGGAAIGDWVELFDIAANQWAVRGSVTATGAPATCFSDTVA